MKKPQIDTPIELAALAIGGVIILETIALLKGVDGVMFGAAMGALGIILGWICKTYHK